MRVVDTAQHISFAASLRGTVDRTRPDITGLRTAQQTRLSVRGTPEDQTATGTSQAYKRRILNLQDGLLDELHQEAAATAASQLVGSIDRFAIRRFDLSVLLKINNTKSTRPPTLEQQRFSAMCAARGPRARCPTITHYPTVRCFDRGAAGLNLVSTFHVV